MLVRGEPARTVRPYAVSGGPPRQILSPLADGSEIQARMRPKTPEHRPRRDLMEEQERGLIQVATRIIGGQGIITFIIIHNEIIISIPSISLDCNLHCHCGFVLEFTPLFLLHSQDYDDVLDCFHV